MSSRSPGVSHKLLQALGRTCCGIKGIDALLRLAHHPDQRARWHLEAQTRALWGGPRFHISTNSFTEWTTFFYGSQDRTIHRWLRAQARKDWVCFDVGMNFGFFACLCGQLGREVHGFEPVSELASRARQNCALNKLTNVIVNELALTDLPGVVEFYPPTAGSSNLGTGSLVHRASGNPVTVQATTLDAYVGQAKLTRIDFIKIDVEGAEHLVLRGAATLLVQYRPRIIFEWNDESCEEAVHQLRRANYDLRLLDGRHSDLQRGAIIDGTNILALPK